METIADRLKAAREKKGWKQAQLAVAADVSTGTIGNIEAGIRKSKGSIPQIAKALGVSYEWLSNGVGDMLPTTGNATLTLPAMTVQASGTTAPVLVITDQCRDIMAAMATLPDDPFIRTSVVHEIMQVIKQARDSPGAHQEPPAYKHAATRSG